MNMGLLTHVLVAAFFLLAGLCLGYRRVSPDVVGGFVVLAVIVAALI